MLKRAVPWVLVGVLGVFLILSLADSGEPSIEVVKEHTDTLIITKVCTLTVEKPIIKETKVVDEKFIYVHDTIRVPIPISEYRFFEKDLYDITARGYEVSLNNVTVYPKTEYKTITNTVEKEIYRDSWNCYLGTGFWAFDKEIVPTVNLILKTQNKWLFGANVGYYNKNTIYGVSVNYKIIGK